MADTKKRLPPFLTICGILYYIKNTDNELQAADLISRSCIENQTIDILSSLPFAVQCRTLCNEVMWQLLSASGMCNDKCTKMSHTTGNALHNFLSSNTFEWVRNASSPLPTTVNINGAVYDIHTDRDEHLNDLGLSGEIVYDQHIIAVYSGMEVHASRVILCHEIAHGLLFESGRPEQNDETLIAPLGYFLYQLLQQNDFNFMRG